MINPNSERKEKTGSGPKRYQRHIVVENYHDHSHDHPNGEEFRKEAKEAKEATLAANINHDHPKHKYCTFGRKFPMKLLEILDGAEVKGIAGIISWKIHGRAFFIHNTMAFAERVMPLWFNQSSIRSFYRQLCLYGFKRLTIGCDKGAYYHELFLPGKPFLACRILRLKVKGTRALPSPETEPNFYAMPYVSASVSSPIESLSFPSKNNSPSTRDSSSTSALGTCIESSKNGAQLQCKTQNRMKSQSSQGAKHGSGHPDRQLHHNVFVQEREQNDFSTLWTFSMPKNTTKDDTGMFKSLQSLMEFDHIKENSFGHLHSDPFDHDDISIDDQAARHFSLFECQVMCSLCEGME